jgi:broad specificity phosphatase PhoE
MVRHGQASFGQKNYDKLSEKGHEQCRILAEYMIRVGLSFGAVYAGNLVRQQETAQEVIRTYRLQGFDLPEIRVLPEFNEYRSRDIIMAHIHDVAGEYPELQVDPSNLYADKKAFSRVFEKIMMRWVSGEREKPGVTRWHDFRDGVRSGLRKVMAEHPRQKNVLICTSGGVISAAVQMALDISDEKALRIAWHVVNSSMTAFYYNHKHFSLSSFNQQAHLELLQNPEWVTYW